MAGAARRPILRRMRGLVRIGLAASVAAIAPMAACFPDYGVVGGDAAAPSEAGGDQTLDGPAPGQEAGPGDASPDALDGGAPVTDASGMVTIQRGSFMMGASAATLTHAFLVDQYEATVDRFLAWSDAGLPAPCGAGSCPIDVAGGPYAGNMVWDASWNGQLAMDAWKTTCSSAAGWAAGTAGLADAGLAPVTCVNWYQAVAMCAFEHKRLLTETEYQYVASGRGQGRTYPWGDADPTDCTHAIWGAPDASPPLCGWPTLVGTASAGVSRDGVYDLAGSAYEWVWDAMESYPPQTTDYAGVAYDGGQSRGTRGGSFAWDASHLRADYRDTTDPGSQYADVGFRCALSVP
jgi:formylglycine-generating enzyme required for sulfatase activity